MGIYLPTGNTDMSKRSWHCGKEGTALLLAQLLHFRSCSLLTTWEEQQKMAQLFGSLHPCRGTPHLHQDQHWLHCHVGNQTVDRRAFTGSLDHSLALCLSSLCNSFKINTFKHTYTYRYCLKLICLVSCPGTEFQHSCDTKNKQHN